MLKTIIHDSNKSYLDNRKDLIVFLDSRGYKTPHYIANDIEDNKILVNRLIKMLLKLNKFLFLRNTNKKIIFTHEEMVVAIGIIINPIDLK